MATETSNKNHAQRFRGNAKAMFRRIPVGILAGFICLLSAYGCWSVYGEKTTEVDINSGRLRVRTEIFERTVTEDVVEWTFSRAVARHGLAKNPAIYKFAWSSPVGLRDLLGDPDATGKLGYALADLRSVMGLSEKYPAMLEPEPTAKLLQMLGEADSHGINEFTDKVLTELEAGR